MGQLRNRLVKLKDSSIFLTRLWYILRVPVFFILKSKSRFCERRRRKGYEDVNFLALRYFRDRYRGKRCFIVATGPSLTIGDVEALENEITFGMNSVTLLYSKTKWRPTFYGIQDVNVYRILEQSICSAYTNAENVFVSNSIAEQFDVPRNFIRFPHNAVYHDNELAIDRYFAEFSDDCYSVVYDGYSITYSLMQIAAYMGFTEIYLLGVDCSYKRGAKNHIVESGNDDKNEEKNHDKMIVGYQTAKAYADSRGVKIINCTRGGMLEVFPRMTLEDVLKENKDENSCNRSDETE